MNDTPAQNGAPNAEPQYRRKRGTRLPLVVGVLALVAAIVIGVVAFIGQSANRQEPGADSGDAPAAEPSQLTVGLTLEPTNLDIRNTSGVALDQILIDNIYQGLVGFASGTFDVQPVLAEDYRVSDDGLTYEFELRDGVTFHSGNELTVDDVVWSLETGLAAIEGAEVTANGDGNIEIALTEPNSQLLSRLAGREGLIFEEASTINLATEANGTGPYTLATWKQADSITFEANPDYWGEPASLDTVVFRYIPDGSAAVSAAAEGDLDVLSPVVPSLRAQLENDSTFTLVRAASTDVFTLAFNNRKAPLDDVRVRTALAQAIDAESIVEAFSGDGAPLGSPITELEPGYVDLSHLNAYDPENARALLAEAGIDQLALTLTVPNFYDTVPLDLLVTQFAEVGVTLTVNSVEFGVWLSDVLTPPADGSARTFDLSYIDHAEAFDFGNYANPDYYFGYDNPQVQQLFAASLAATDESDAESKLEEAARLVAHDAPAKWLINYTPSNAVGVHVSGFPDSNTNSRINLEGVTIEP